MKKGSSLSFWPGFTYLYARDDPGVVERYHATHCPKAYVLDQDLRIRYVSPEARGEASTAAVVRDVLRVLGLE